MLARFRINGSRGLGRVYRVGSGHCRIANRSLFNDHGAVAVLMSGIAGAINSSLSLPYEYRMLGGQG